jgi:hypothetical protein
MLSHISHKFTQPVKPVQHEPRAALFLNRFTRTLTIMYATSALEEVIGIPASVMRGRSFYYCIAENCLQDSINCLENAKGNDSIAYLRFWFRDPRADDPAPALDNDSDDEMTTEMSEDTSEGGVQLQSHGASSSARSNASAAFGSAVESSDSMEVDDMVGAAEDPNSRTSSGDSGNEIDTHEAIFGESRESRSSASSVPSSPVTPRRAPARATNDPIELEAVISCASDGLVVCLRKARPMVPHPTQRPSQPAHPNGVFAAPWATQPVLPPLDARPRAGFASGFAPSLGPMAARHDSASPPRVHGPDSQDFMSVIREQAVFAWALTGINGSLAEHAKGKPTGSSAPSDGFSVWANDAAQNTGSTESHHDNGRSHGDERRAASQMFGDPGLGRGGGNGFMR